MQDCALQRSAEIVERGGRLGPSPHAANVRSLEFQISFNVSLWFRRKWLGCGCIGKQRVLGCSSGCGLACDCLQGCNLQLGKCSATPHCMVRMLISRDISWVFINHTVRTCPVSCASCETHCPVTCYHPTAYIAGTTTTLGRSFQQNCCESFKLGFIHAQSHLKAGPSRK